MADNRGSKRSGNLFSSVFVQVTAIAALCSALVAGAMAYETYRKSVRDIHAEVDTHAGQITPLLARQLTGALRFGKADQIQPTLDALVRGDFGPATAAVVLNAQGVLIASAQSGGDVETLRRLAQEAIASRDVIRGRGLQAAAFPVLAPDGGAVLGAIATGWTAATAIDELRDNISLAIGTATGAFLFASVLAMLLTRLRIARPLVRVNAAMSRVAQKDYGTAIPERARRDEIGAIARSLQDFRDSLRVADEANRIGLLKGSAFEGSSAPLMVTDEAFRIRFANPALIAFFRAHAEDFRRASDIRAGLRNFTAESVVGRPLQDLLGDDLPLTAILEGRTRLPQRISVRFGQISVQVDVDGVRDAGDPDAARLGYVLEWKNVSTEQRNSAILEAIDSSFLRAEFSAAGALIEANDRFARVADPAGAGLAGAAFDSLLTAGPDAGGAGGENSIFHEAMTRGGFKGPLRLRSAQAKETRLDATLTLIRDEHDAGTTLLLLATDVTDAQGRLAEAAAQREAFEAEQRMVVETLRAALGRLSEGDLTTSIETAFGEDYATLRSDFNAATERLRAAMREVIENAAAIRTETGEISTAADDLSRRTEQQAATLEETAAALDELTSSVRSAADVAATANRMVADAKERAETSGRVVREAVTAMGEIEESSGRISRIIGVIDEIAFQTNLLALNAGVEAARAGEAGRGFAVVASEVRALAQRSSEAAREIAGLITASSGQVKRGVELVGEAGKALGGIQSSVSEIFTCVSEIAVSAREQSSGLAEINTAVNQLDQVTQQNAAMFEQTSAASQSLLREASALAATVGRFRTSGALSPAATEPAPPPPDPSWMTEAQAPFRTRRQAATRAASSAPQAAAEDDWEEF